MRPQAEGGSFREFPEVSEVSNRRARLYSAPAPARFRHAECDARKLGRSFVNYSFRGGYAMEHRFLGASGFKVPVLSFGTATFGGKGEFFEAWGATEVAEARRMIDMCLDAGVSMFDSADIYSNGASESVLGEALKGRRDKAIISTKATFRFDSGPNSVGSSRVHLRRAVDAALKRLQTDYIDLFQLHGFDAKTPAEEVLSTLDDLVRAGKILYTGVSNFSGWHLMKSLDVADRYGYPRYVANQTYYSLIGRDYEWELMPLGIDQGVGAVVWSPLGWGRLTGKIRRGQPLPDKSRLHKTADMGPPVPDEYLYRVIDAIDEIAQETGKTVPQIALNWLLQRPTVSTVLIGARDEAQLRQNLGAVGWNLTAEQVAKLDAASAVRPVYPYWHQEGFAERNPSPV
jgi:aryl-alcohol dehydrogenase-like predicted oxidoreductase